MRVITAKRTAVGPPLNNKPIIDEDLSKNKSQVILATYKKL